MTGDSRSDSHLIRNILTVLAILLCATPSSAQTAVFEGKTITDIQFRPLQPLHPADLDVAVPLKKGAPLRASEVAAAIDGLFATGRFEDIAVEAEPDGDNGVVVRFVTQLAW